MSTNDGDSIPDRDHDGLIRFESKPHYDHFVDQLKLQLRSYLLDSCQANHIQVGSHEFRIVESILIDVFMKYTLEFIRENLLVEGLPLAAPPEFATTSQSSRSLVNGNSSHHQNNHRPSSNRNTKDSKQPMTRPCDTALNERVIRQQYALYDAAVGNTRKRKDFTGHIAQRVDQAAQESIDQLQSSLDEVQRLEAHRIQTLEIDPRQRWDVKNAKIPNPQRTQDDCTSTNQMICKLMKSLPELIESASQAIDLHEEVTNALKPV